MIGTFSALDLVLFFLFFEVVLIPMWLVIDIWGDDHDPAGRRRAATTFVLMTVLGSALMLLGFLLRASPDGDVRPRVPGQPPCRQGRHRVSIAAILIALGLAVKMPLWPLHIWLPDAHAKAPTVGSVLLAGVLLKLGSYGMIRILLPSLPDATRPRSRRTWPVLDRRDHRRVAGLPRADRCETADRVLQRRPHGLHRARHRDHVAGRPERRAVREHRARHHHRPAVLPGRGDQGPA